jgi:EAL domain-containing protein (putative c-di-GMP-specific phosphodiesterase class I)
VKNLPGNAADHSIVKATILMAHELGLTCLAEGVETRAQHETLLQLNCDHFQGYRLGKPRSADAFAEWLRN